MTSESQRRIRFPCPHVGGAAVITVSVMFRVDAHRQNLSLRNRFWCPDADARAGGLQVSSPFKREQRTAKPTRVPVWTHNKTKEAQRAGHARARHQSLRPKERHAGVAINHRTQNKTKLHKRTSSCRAEQEVWGKMQLKAKQTQKPARPFVWFYRSLTEQKPDRKTLSC